MMIQSDRMRTFVLASIFVLAVGTRSAVADPDHDDLLKQAEQVAESIRASSDGTPPSEEQVSTLRDLVARSFAARQSRQRAELESMRERLRAAESRLKQRESLRDRIVTRKVEDLLSAGAANWDGDEKPSSEPSLAFDVIEANDILGVYIEGVLPYNPPNQPAEPPPVGIAQDGRPYTGFPLAVASDGTVALPLIDPVDVAGLTVRQAATEIARQYVEKDILRPSKAKPIVSLISRFENAAQETAPSAAVTGLAERPKAFGSSPSPQDEYGSVVRAAELVTKWFTIDKKTTESLNAIRKRLDTLGLRREVRRGLTELQLSKQRIGFRIARARQSLESAEGMLPPLKRRLEHAEHDYRQGVISQNAVESVRSELSKQIAVVEQAELELLEVIALEEAWDRTVGTWIEDTEVILGDAKTWPEAKLETDASESP